MNTDVGQRNKSRRERDVGRKWKEDDNYIPWKLEIPTSFSEAPIYLGTLAMLDLGSLSTLRVLPYLVRLPSHLDQSS